MFREYPIACGAKSNTRGMSLLEVVIATMIFGLVLGGAISAMAQGFYSIERSRDLNLASQIMQTQMEWIRMLNWNGIDDLQGTEDFTPPARQGDRTLRNLVCTRVVEDEKLDQKRITLTIAWDDHRSIRQTRTYFMLYTKEGLSDFYSRSF